MDSEIDDEKPIIEEESNQEQLKITKRKIISKDNQKSVKRIKDELEDNDVKTLDEPKDAKSTKKIDKTEKKEEILEKKDASKLKITKTKQEQVEPELFSKSRLKKTEVIKRKVETPKMEEVKLKHHDFELAPLEPTKEEKTSVKLSRPLKDLTDLEKKTKKVKKVIKKPLSLDNRPDEPIPWVLDLRDLFHGVPPDVGQEGDHAVRVVRRVQRVY